MSGTVWSRLAAAAAMVAWIATAGAAVAEAHAQLERAEPVSGAVVAADGAPRRLSLQFSEPVTVAFNGITVLDANSGRVDHLDARVSDTDPTRVEVTLATLDQGAYAVRWQVTSADNHVVRGAYWFAVGFAAAPPPGALAGTEAPTVPPLEVAGRVLMLVAVLTLAGGATFRVLIAPAIDRRLGAPMLSSRLVLERQQVVWLTAAALLCLGQLLLAAAQAESIAGVPLPRALEAGVPAIVLIGSSFAVLWWSRLVLGLLTTGALLLAAKSRGWGPIAVALGVLLIASVSLGSHASAARVQPVLATVVDGLHLAAAAVWLGGLVQVALAVSVSNDRRPLLRRLVPRISTVALVCVGVLVLTGVFSAWEQVASVQALLDTPYGQSLLLKVGLLVVLLGTAAVNLLVIRPRVTTTAAPQPELSSVFQRLVLTELALGTGLLMAVGVLSTLPPPAAASPPAVFEATRQLSDIRATLTVDPNWVGISRFRLRLVDGQGGAPADVQNVVFTFSMQGMNMGRTTVFATAVGEGVYETTGFYVGMPGLSQVGVSIARGGVADQSTVFVVEVPDLNRSQFNGLRGSLGVGPVGLLGLGFAVLACVASLVWSRGPTHRKALASAAFGMLLVGGGAFAADRSITANASSLDASLAKAAANTVHGKALYQEHCVLCHGETGIGNGVAAASLLPPPSDLTLHARWHPDEQLNWFIANGVAGTAMPSWSAVLDADGRRDVIGFLHELASAPTASPLVLPAQQPTAAPVPPTPIPAVPVQVSPPTAMPAATAAQSAQASPTAGLLGRLVFGPDTDGNLWIWNFPAEKPDRLTRFGAGEFSSSPVWSPDGRRIAFSYYKLPRTGSLPVPEGTDLYLANADGTEPRLLSAHQAKGSALQFPVWAPDGKSIYVSYRDLGGTEAHVDRVDAESGARTQIVQDAGFPAISADGSKLAYATSPAGAAQQGTSVWWSEPNGDNPHQVLGPLIFQKFWGLRFSPDGQRLVFAAIGAGNNYVPPQGNAPMLLGWLFDGLQPRVAHADGEAYDLWTIGLDGRDLRRVTTLSEDLPIAAWSPDGQQIAFLGGGSATAALSGLAVVNVDGTNLRRLTGVPGHRGLDWTTAP